MPEQSAKSHASSDRVFLSVAVILAINVIVACVRAYHLRDGYAHWQIIVAIALVVAVMKIRGYGTKNQDRIIRIEEQVRLARILPEPLLTQSASLTTDQYVGLRFASDAELPSLVTRTLAENLTRKQIKEAITTWRPDHQRL